MDNFGIIDIPFIFVSRLKAAAFYHKGNVRLNSSERVFGIQT